jgi:hypothetical protein
MLRTGLASRRKKPTSAEKAMRAAGIGRRPALAVVEIEWSLQKVYTDSAEILGNVREWNYDLAVSHLLTVRGLTVELPTPLGWVRPVNDISLRISKGESLGLVGESGSGKTMLSLTLMGLLPTGARVSGEAMLDAANTQPKDLAKLASAEWRSVRGGEIAMVFQEPMTSLNPVMRIGPQIEEAMRAHEPGISRIVMQRRLVSALEHACSRAGNSRGNFRINSPAGCASAR